MQAALEHTLTDERPGGVTRWTRRALAALSGLSRTTVQRIWRSPISGFVADQASSTPSMTDTVMNTDGRRGILGLGLNPSEAALLWLGILRGLERR